MRILIAGDSLTEGVTGVGYIKKLMPLMPNDEFVNLGLGGDTLIGIGNRLLEYLKDDSDFDIIIIEAGHNDLLIPSFEEREFPFKMTAYALKKRGSIPIEDEDIFSRTYLSTLKAIKRLSDAKIYVTTLSCIGENLGSILNMKRRLYNKAITNTVKLYNSENVNSITIIDIEGVIDNQLRCCETSDYLLDDYFSSFFIDAHHYLSDERAAELSSERGLMLTMDGVHPNANGANILAHIFYNTILSSLI